MQQAALAKDGETPGTRRRGRPKTRLSTIDELADYLHIHKSTVYRLIDTKQLPCLRVGFVLRFDIPTVLKWAQNFTDRGDQLTWADDITELKRKQGAG
jgi:excisionase family DNA binding protein